MQTIQFESPIGLTTITGNDTGVSVISCTNHAPTPSDFNSEQSVARPLIAARIQLQEYFAATRHTFDFLINPVGTDFQQRVWRELLTVPFGTTMSYMALSRRLGDENAIRAVAAANGRNPLWIVVPCHRIIGSDGSLTGYAGGLWRKKWLIEHEQKLVQLSLF